MRLIGIIQISHIHKLFSQSRGAADIESNPTLAIGKPHQKYLLYFSSFDERAVIAGVQILITERQTAGSKCINYPRARARAQLRETSNCRRSIYILTSSRIEQFSL